MSPASRWGGAALLAVGLAQGAHAQPGRQPPPPVAWSASVEGLATVGNSDRLVGGARASVRLPTTGPVQLVLRPSLFLGRVNGRTTDRELRADGVLYVAPGDADAAPVYAFALALYSESRLRRIDRRVFTGAGVGWRPVRGASRALALSAAPVAEWTSYETSPDGEPADDRRRLRLSLRAEGHVPLAPSVTLRGETFVKPAPAEPSDVVWLTTTALDVVVAPQVTLRLALDDVYESRSAPTVEPRDLRLTVGLRLASR